MRSLWVLFLYLIFEPGILLFTGLSVLNKDIINWKRFASFSIITGIAEWMIRNYIIINYGFGYHVLPILLVHIILGITLLNMERITVINSILIGFTLLIGIESIIVPLLAKTFGSLTIILSQPVLHISGGWIIGCCLITIGLGVKNVIRKYT
ncbi:hypothetical protein GJ688_12485 [Heliobacillus mobilis]|uniref:Uncharacterized protein n=1 Tax=Heliobacterium mobile TaxID=28064 RepID=A0A6I3SLM0_HELMO|nr:hypothetical protein [Heliobacterium mobile]MTV49789.1 hypothetical protein [Heliobacterium mobile]